MVVMAVGEEEEVSGRVLGLYSSFANGSEQVAVEVVAEGAVAVKICESVYEVMRC